RDLLQDVQIYDIFGRTVETRHATSLHNGTATIDVSGLPVGLYLLRLYTSEGMVMRKIVVSD
ncbi:MAG: T9SS type A sorting domain-containing protein, partial [Bacteroidales bacterium]|nr:T9SS type A sorting domain-containing protein [Bacteroidales bacterium]